MLALRRSFDRLKNAATLHVAGLRSIQSELHANICEADICTTTFFWGGRNIYEADICVFMLDNFRNVCYYIIRCTLRIRF